MTTPATLTEVFWMVAKILSIVGLVLYAVFAVVMVRQEHLMADVLEEGFEPVLRLLVIAHLVAAVGLFILAIVLL